MSGSQTDLEFLVSEMNRISPAILGLCAWKKLDLIRRVNVVELDSSSAFLSVYADLFEGLGCITNFTYSIKVEGGAKGVILPCRKVHLSLQGAFKAELDRMGKLGVTDIVDGPTEWVNSFVIAHEKD
ncbi:hypothetical protein QAD02_021349 [Eretmocerus hayati]|uniref:Uncharacterized protein n=1 Tax=Eretmocerus hayati TaxID=131215 RepID=A0ACC2PRV4_9HYME|nr:hypothetical protein QAD02_021349 [Eretmocerus hayati]